MVMRKTAISILTLITAGAGLSGCGAPAGARGVAPMAQAVVWPHRQAGLWQETLIRDGAAAPTKSALVCLGAGPVTDIAPLGRAWGHGDCQRTLTQSRDGTYHFSSACRLGGGTLMTTKGVASGDFTTHYALTADVQVEDAPIAALDGRRSLKISGVYRGPCPIGMKPGKIARAEAPRFLASAGG
jgi:hypothetical protein